MLHKLMYVGVVTAIATMCLPDAAQAQKIVLVVRHAERADAGAPPMQTQTDPPLSATGEARAAKLASMLADSGTTAIFATEFRRTMDTASPLAKKLGVQVQRIPQNDTEALVTALRTKHATDIVLVVGHSNTVPAVIKAFGGPDVTVGDNEYDNLFVVVPATSAVTRIKFTP